MPHEYTRQRQGRDFSLQEYLTKVNAENNENTEVIRKDDEKKKSLHKRIKKYTKEAARNAVPIDGYEPPEKGGIR